MIPEIVFVPVLLLDLIQKPIVIPLNPKKTELIVKNCPIDEIDSGDTNLSTKEKERSIKKIKQTKQIVKGIIERMGDLFEEIAKTTIDLSEDEKLKMFATLLADGEPEVGK